MHTEYISTPLTFPLHFLTTLPTLLVNLCKALPLDILNYTTSNCTRTVLMNTLNANDDCQK